MARHLEGQLHLTVMVALVPEHVLEQEDRVVVVKVHVPACLHPAPYRVPHHLGAFVQHLRDAIRVTLDHPLFLGHVSGELGASSKTNTSRTYWMCVNSSATDGLLSIALASSPPSGRARSRLSRMMLFRSQESSRASSRRWSGASNKCSVLCARGTVTTVSASAPMG